MTSRAVTVSLLQWADLTATYPTSRAIQTAVRDVELQKVRSGIYVRAADVVGFTREERAIVRVRALQTRSKRRPVAAHLSAAAIHGLPLWDVKDDDRRVHVVSPRDRPGAAGLTGPTPRGAAG